MGVVAAFKVITTKAGEGQLKIDIIDENDEFHEVQVNKVCLYFILLEAELYISVAKAVKWIWYTSCKVVYLFNDHCLSCQ